MEAENRTDHPPYMTNEVMCQLTDPEGDPLGPVLILPQSDGPKELTHIVNELLKNEENLPYTFYVFGQELVVELCLYLAESKVSAEKVLTIVYQPQEVFRTPPVSCCSATITAGEDTFSCTTLFALKYNGGLAIGADSRSTIRSNGKIESENKNKFHWLNDQISMAFSGRVKFGVNLVSQIQIEVARVTKKLTSSVTSHAANYAYQKIREASKESQASEASDMPFGIVLGGVENGSCELYLITERDDPHDNDRDIVVLGSGAKHVKKYVKEKGVTSDVSQCDAENHLLEGIKRAKQYDRRTGGSIRVVHIENGGKIWTNTAIPEEPHKTITSYRWEKNLFQPLRPGDVA